MIDRTSLAVLVGLLTTALGLQCPKQTTSPGREVVCYTSVTNVEELTEAICKCTTLVHQGHDARNVSTSEFKDFQKSLKEILPPLQFMISIDDPGKALRTSGAVRQQITAHLLGVLKEVDGVELNATAGSKERLLHFVKGLKDELVRKSYEKRIFLVLPTKSEDLAKQFDLKELSKYVDLFAVPTHYLVEDEETYRTFHPSRLMGLFDMFNADSLIDLISGLGTPKRKILMSLPASAFKFSLEDENDNAPRAPTVDTQPITIDQKQLCDLMNKEGWTVERDEDLTAPYAFKDKMWIAFEDKISVAIKGKYVLLRDLPGLAIHDVQNDLKTECNRPLTHEIHRSFSSFKRKSRAAVLNALEDELHQTQLEYPTKVKSSNFRVVRVVDTEGHIRAVRENTQIEFTCSRQGYFVHPKSCNRFYRCVKFNQEVEDYSVFEFDCPAGLSFDERTEVCVWPGSMPEGSPCPGSSEIAPVARIRFECPSKPGYYADPQNPRWFFACIDLGGPELMAYEFRCPFGLIFDEQKLICEWPWLVAGYIGYTSSGYATGSTVATGGYYTGGLPDGYTGTAGRGYSGSIIGVGLSGPAGVGYAGGQGSTGTTGSLYSGSGYSGSTVSGGTGSGTVVGGYSGSGRGSGGQGHLEGGVSGGQSSGGGRVSGGTTASGYSDRGSSYGGQVSGADRGSSYTGGYSGTTVGHGVSFDQGTRTTSIGYSGSITDAGRGYSGSVTSADHGYSGQVTGTGRGYSEVGVGIDDGSTGKAGSPGYSSSVYTGATDYGLTSGIYTGSKGKYSGAGQIFTGYAGTGTIGHAGTTGAGQIPTGYAGIETVGPSGTTITSGTGYKATDHGYSGQGVTGYKSGSKYSGTTGGGYSETTSGGYGTVPAGYTGTTGAHRGYAGTSGAHVGSTVGGYTGTSGTHVGSTVVYKGTSGAHIGSTVGGYTEETSGGAGGYAGTSGTHIGSTVGYKGTSGAHIGSTVGGYTEETSGGAGGYAGTSGAHIGSTIEGGYPGTSGVHVGTTVGGYKGTSGAQIGSIVGGGYPGTSGGRVGGFTEETSGGAGGYGGTSGAHIGSTIEGGYPGTSGVHVGTTVGGYKGTSGAHIGSIVGGGYPETSGGHVGGFTEETSGAHVGTTAGDYVATSGVHVGYSETNGAHIGSTAGGHSTSGTIYEGPTETSFVGSTTGLASGHPISTGIHNTVSVGYTQGTSIESGIKGAYPGSQSSTRRPSIGLSTSHGYPEQTGTIAPGVKSPTGSLLPGQTVKLGIQPTQTPIYASSGTIGTGLDSTKVTSIHGQPFGPIIVDKPEQPLCLVNCYGGVNATGLTVSPGLSSLSKSPIPTGYGVPTRPGIVASQDVQGSTSPGGSITYGGTSGTVLTGSTGQAGIITETGRPGYTKTGPGILGYVISDGVKTVYPGSASSTTGVIITSTPPAGTVIKGQISPGIVLTGPTASIGGTGYEITQSGDVKIGTVPYDTSYKTNEYHDNGGRGTIKFNNGGVTTKYTENDIPDYRPTGGTIVPGIFISGTVTPTGFAKTGPTKTGGGKPRPKPSPKEIGPNAFEGNVVGYTKSSTEASDETLSNGLGPTKTTGYSYDTPSIPFETGVTTESSTIGQARPIPFLTVEVHNTPGVSDFASITGDIGVYKTSSGAPTVAPGVYTTGPLKTPFGAPKSQPGVVTGSSNPVTFTQDKYDAHRGSQFDYGTKTSQQGYTGAHQGPSTTPQYYYESTTGLPPKTVFPGVSESLKPQTQYGQPGVYQSTPSGTYTIESTTIRSGSPTNVEISREEVGKLVTNYNRGSSKYVPNQYDIYSTGADYSKTQSSSIRPGYVSTTPAMSGRTPSSLTVQTYSKPSSIITYQTTGKTTGLSKGKVIVKWSDLHPLLLGKLGAECTCRGDPFANLRGPGSKLINSSKGKVDLSNYDESDIYVDLEKDDSNEDYVTNQESSAAPPVKIWNKELSSLNYQVEEKPSNTYLPSSTLSTSYRAGKSLRNAESSTISAVRNEGFSVNRSEDDLEETIDGATNCARPGLFRHPNFCNKFYGCHWDEQKKKFSLHVFSCPVHLTFDNGASACNWPSMGPACQDNNLLV